MKKIPMILVLISSSVFSQNFPDWAEGIVWYQIFPERFANGDSSNDPTAEKVFLNQHNYPKDWHITKWTSNWFAKPDWGKNQIKKFNDIYLRRYGGDIQGIINKLDYLKELGIGAIYFNPMFEAVSLHKYDGSTYHHIDINFGPDPEKDLEIINSEKPDDPSTWKWTSADSLFLKLIDEVHSRGMFLILDGVFNHTGEQFWAFHDLQQKQKESEYKDWYIVKSFDDPSTSQNEFDYKGWWGTKSLPEFNRTENDLHPGPKQYIFYATQRWMDPNNDGDHSDGIDGWRLDVARDVPMGFWKDWKKVVKTLNPKAIIVGELWELSPDFIAENGAFDALMNYNFAYAVKQFFIDKKNKISASAFIDSLKNIDKTYSDKYLNILQNLMDSHDTERLSSLIKNPDKGFDREGNEGNPNYNPSKPTEEEYETQKLVAAFQMTYRGAPMIYYGDETGMWGADDPHDRKPMVWDDLKYEDEIITASSGFKKGFGKYSVEQNKDLLNHYKKIISIRNNNSTLKTGDVDFIYSNDEKGTVAFKRQKGNEIFIAAFNTGKKEDSFSYKFDTEKIFYDELITGEKGSGYNELTKKAEINISIPPKSVRIFKIYFSK